MKIPFRLRSTKVSALLAVLLALTACDTYSDNGEWTGTIRVQDDDQSFDSRYCETDLEVSRTSETAELRDLAIFCGPRTIRWSSGVLDRRGNEFWQNGQKVGEIFPDGTVRVQVKDPYANVNYPRRVEKVTLTWTRMGEELHFVLKEETEWRTRTYEGSLQRRR